MSPEGGDRSDWVPRSRLEREQAARQRAEFLLEQRSRELYDAQRTQQRFIKSMNHEFRTPLNGVLVPAQLLQEADLDPETRLFAATIEQSAKQLERMIEAAIAGAELVADAPRTAVNVQEKALVLLVDDDAVNRRVARAAVESIGMLTIEAENGQRALELTAERRPHAILMDVQMPVMSGDIALRTIRSSPEPWRDTPIIIITADAEHGGDQVYTAMGANGYMLKPFSVRELQRKLCELVCTDRTRCEVKQPSAHGLHAGLRPG